MRGGDRRLEALRHEFLAHERQSERFVRFGVELIDDRVGRAGRDEQAVPVLNS